MYLQSDHTPVDALRGLLVDHLRGGLAVDREREAFASNGDMNQVPPVGADVARSQRVFEIPKGPVSGFADRDDLPAVDEIRAARVAVEVPGAEHAGSDPDVAEIGVVARDTVRLGMAQQAADVNPRVGRRADPVGELQFEITQFSAGPDEVRALALRPADDPSAMDRPVSLTFGRDNAPTVKAGAVEDRNETVIRGAGRGEDDAEGDDRYQQPEHGRRL